MIEKRFGVVGDPITHSLSPHIHSLAYDFYQLDYSYSAHQVPAGQLRAFIESHPDLSGLSVTMPLKFEATELADAADSDATITGVTNTLAFKEGKALGCNTDVYGISKSISEQTLGPLHNVAILGSGATARSAVQAISSTYPKAEVTVFLRNPRAELEIARLFTEVDLKFKSIQDLTGKYDLSINAIPAVLEISGLESAAVLNVNYMAPQTWGESVAIIEGKEMLIWQAIAQMRLWYFDGVPALPDEDRFVKTVRESLIGR
ncbi:MAG: shikimate dehydrogenase family protein [Rhodoluna sp.]